MKGADPGPIPLARRLLYSAIAVVLTYGVFEGVASWLYATGHVDPAPCWVLEDPGEGRAVQFDPVRGYRLSSTHPARLGVVTTAGEVASLGTLRGNNEGFPDRDDFTPAKPADVAVRYAVFGRSYTAAQFMERNWPDAVEDLTAAAESRLQLLNLSIDGGGAVNWWSVIQRFLEPNGYEVDRMVFAVNPAALYGGFTIWDDRLASCGEDRRCLAQGCVPTHDLNELPRNLSEAARWFRPQQQWPVLPSEELDALVAGRTRLRTHRPFVLYVAGRARMGFSALTHRPAAQVEPDDARYTSIAGDKRVQRGGWPHGEFVVEPVVATDHDRPSDCGADCMDMMMDLRGYLQENRIPALVVYIPDPSIYGSESVRHARWFAAVTGSAFVDGCSAFAGMDPGEVDASFILRDGHWNQAGSDRFAELMAEVLTTWDP